jgi:plastocyanin
VKSPHALAAETRRFTLKLTEGQLADAPAHLRVMAGDEVVIAWTSDRGVELHLHGYNLHARPAPGQPAEMAFRAHATGRYPIELHDGENRHRPVIYLEVHPR